MAEQQDAGDPRRRQTRDYPDSPISVEEGFATATTLASRHQQQQQQQHEYEHEPPPTPRLPDDNGDDGLTTDTDSDTDDDMRVRTNVTNVAPNPVPQKPSKKAGWLAAMAAKLGLDMPTVITMFKYVVPGFSSR